MKFTKDEKSLLLLMLMSNRSSVVVNAYSAHSTYDKYATVYYFSTSPLMK